MKPSILVSLPGQGRPENYLEAIAAAGGEPKGGYAPEVDLSCQGLILCGGPDLAPELYGQENRESVGIEPERDRAELALARAFFAAGKPILGICRGMQLLNVVFGGTLIQDLPTRRRHTSDGNGDLVHETWCAEGSLLFTLFGKSLVTNSSHHQAVGRLGNGLLATQWSENGRVVEGFEHRSLPVFAVQWHPERMCCTHLRQDTVDAMPLLEAFVKLCKA